MPAPLRLAALAALLPLAACESFIEVDRPAAPALSVNATFSPDTVWTVTLFRTRPIGAPGPNVSPPLPGAAVTVRPVGGEPLRVVDRGGGTYRSRPGELPAPGEPYELVVEHPELGRVTATTAPAPPPPVVAVSSPVYTRTLTVGPGEAFDYYRFRIDLTGVPTAPHYAFRIEQEEPGQRDLRPVFFDADDPDLRADFGDDGPLRSFGLFRSAVLRRPLAPRERRTVTLEAAALRGSPPAFHLDVVALSDDLTEYLRTRALQDRFGDDPFAEPVRLFSNVEGGVGIFAGYRRRSVTLALPPPPPLP